MAKPSPEYLSGSKYRVVSNFCTMGCSVHYLQTLDDVIKGIKCDTPMIDISTVKEVHFLTPSKTSGYDKERIDKFEDIALKPGHYRLTVEEPGYQSYTVDVYHMERIDPKDNPNAKFFTPDPTYKNGSKYMIPGDGYMSDFYMYAQNLEELIEALKAHVFLFEDPQQLHEIVLVDDDRIEPLANLEQIGKKTGLYRMFFRQNPQGSDYDRYVEIRHNERTSPPIKRPDIPSSEYADGSKYSIISDFSTFEPIRRYLLTHNDLVEGLIHATPLERLSQIGLIERLEVDSRRCGVEQYRSNRDKFQHMRDQKFKYMESHPGKYRLTFDVGGCLPQSVIVIHHEKIKTNVDCLKLGSTPSPEYKYGSKYSVIGDFAIHEHGPRYLLTRDDLIVGLKHASPLQDFSQVTQIERSGKGDSYTIVKLEDLESTPGKYRLTVKVDSLKPFMIKVVHHDKRGNT
jgi:hypothetical protein